MFIIPIRAHRLTTTRGGRALAASGRHARGAGRKRERKCGRWPSLARLGPGLHTHAWLSVSVSG